MRGRGFSLVCVSAASDSDSDEYLANTVSDGHSEGPECVEWARSPMREKRYVGAGGSIVFSAPSSDPTRSGFTNTGTIVGLFDQRAMAILRSS